MELCEGHVCGPAVGRQKPVTYHTWCAGDDSCAFDRPAFHLRPNTGFKKVVALARFSLSSHHLSVESGEFTHIRCSTRFCQHPHCMHLDQVQDEEHVVFRCGKCDELRHGHASLFQDADDEDLRRVWQGDVNDIATSLDVA